MSEERFAHGTFCWNELMTRDTAAAAKFYTELLGWKAVDSGMEGMKYTFWKAGDKEAGGMMEMPAEIPVQVPPHWMTYVAVDDVDALAAKVEGLGGKVLNPVMDIPKVGRFRIVQDPTGAVLSLMTLASKG
ncbi:MAG: VOC family protein [candidate division Zixibacteria bacterium]|nr:VOC family protein [candidate division Zixibacteria bacterium]